MGAGARGPRLRSERCEWMRQLLGISISISAGTGAGRGRFPQKLQALFSAKCNSGDAQACFDLGVQYERWARRCGRSEQGCGSLPKDLRRPLGRGCQRLGDLYWYGIGVKADKQKGAALLKEGCALGSEWACQEVNFLRGSDSDWRPEFDR